MAAKIRMTSKPHKGWQESAENWDLWRRWKTQGDTAARDVLFEKYLPQCSRILAKNVSYIDQREASQEDSLQEAGILMLNIMNEFNPMKAESFKVYIISYGTRRAVDVARTYSTVPRRVREATAIYNEAREQLAAIEGETRSNSPTDIQAVLDFAMEENMWPSWLGKATVSKIQEAMSIRDRGLSSYSLDSMAGSGSGDDEGGQRESVAARVDSHEEEVVEEVMRQNLREILNFILVDLPQYDRNILDAYTNFPLENGEVGGVEGVRCYMQTLSDANTPEGAETEEVSRGRAVKAIKAAQAQARSLFIEKQDDILVRDSDDELLEIIAKYFEAVENKSPEAINGYRKSEELTLI